MFTQLSETNQEIKTTTVISKYTLFWTPDLIQMTTDQRNARGQFCNQKRLTGGNKDQVWGHLKTHGAQ